jgi:hypothetical protein
MIRSHRVFTAVSPNLRARASTVGLWISQHIAEFVLETTVVYSYGRRSPGLQIRPLDLAALNPPFNLPALGRRHPLYVVFDLAESCVFVKQSPNAFHCGPLGL